MSSIVNRSMIVIRSLVRPPPFPPTPVIPFRFLVTTTSVFPSQRPRESPM